MAGERSVELAADLGDGLVGTAPVAESVEQFRDEGGEGKPTYGQLHVCWADDEARRAKDRALDLAQRAISGGSCWSCRCRRTSKRRPKRGEDDVAESVVCGPDPERHRAAIQEYIDAGYDHVYVHQVGPDQDGFFDFYEREVLPAFA